MRILCHRGIWLEPNEKNSWEALTNSIKNGYGLETDIRDCDSKLVISHDMPRSDSVILVDDFLDFYAASGRIGCLALNIKADGLQNELNALLQKYGIENYFVFDMSVPDTLGYLKLQMTFAARISEYEPTNTLLPSADWVWLDAFRDEWYSIDTIRTWLDDGKNVALVSPELHRRPHEQQWAKLKELQNEENFYLCTDFVRQAQEYFHVDKD